jgi:hypothetical protein
VTIAATTPLPQPLAITAPVVNDVANMTLIVRRPDAAGGSEKLLWREAHAALVKAEELGWPNGMRFVWGSAPGHYQFGHAAPGPKGLLCDGCELQPFIRSADLPRQATGHRTAGTRSAGCKGRR